MFKGRMEAGWLMHQGQKSRHGVLCSSDCNPRFGHIAAVEVEQGGIAEPCFSQGWHPMAPVRTARLDNRQFQSFPLPTRWSVLQPEHLCAASGTDREWTGSFWHWTNMTVSVCQSRHLSRLPFRALVWNAISSILAAVSSGEDIPFLIWIFFPCKVISFQERHKLRKCYSSFSLLTGDAWSSGLRHSSIPSPGVFWPV